MRKKFINERGATGLDVGIAVIVIVLFISIVATVFYQIYVATIEAARNNEATSYISRIMENIKSLDYEYISETDGYRDEIESILNGISGEQIQNYSTANNQFETKISGYNITLNIENYSDQNTEAEDVIKKVTINVTYLVNKVEKSIKISTIITK